MVYHGDDFDGIWNSAKGQLQNLGYVCTHQSAQKYRVALKSPATWNPYQELDQETRERCQGLSRAALSKEVASRWRQGARARQPPGANCVDIETYRVNPKKPLNLLGSALTHTKLDDIFPTSVGRFGPLQFSIPRSALMLFKEYGPHCLQHRMVKMKKPRGATWSQAPEIARRAVWPATSLQHAKEYLS